MSSGSTTRQLAEQIVTKDPLKESVVLEAARAGVLDWLASALAARSDSGAQMILSALGYGLGIQGMVAASAQGYELDDPRSGEKMAASVLGRGCRVAPLDAVLVNGYLSHALDYDDVHASVRGHPSAVILPALLAEAEVRRSTGAEFLAAYVIGVETMCRLGLALGPRHYEAGWHSTATLGTLGAAAACARLMKLDVHATMHALGLAGTQSGGLRIHFGSPVKPLHAGFAARGGLLAARLAAAGMTGESESLESPMGFLSIFSGGEAEPGKVLESWGQPWQIVEPGLWFKVYPCCSAANHAADAALAIRAANRPEPSEIAKIAVCFPPGGDAALVIRVPKTGVEGRFSVEYVIAAALTDGELGLDTFDDRPIRSDLQTLAAKVERCYDSKLIPAQNAMPKGRFTVVTVTLADGRTYTERVDCPRGAPGRPLSAAERLAKYEDAVRGLSASWEKLHERVNRLEHMADLSEFIPDI